MSTNIQDVTPDEAAIRSHIMTLEAGWNAGDSTKFASVFSEDADYVVVNGMHIKGRKVIDEGHKGIFSTVYKGSVNKATIKSVRFITPDVAISHVEWFLKFGGDKENKAITSLTWLKKDGKWEAVAFQNTQIQPQGH